MLIREDFGGFLLDVGIYHDGAIKSKKRRFYHEETVYKSGNISQEELHDLLHFFSERGFAEMNRSYEWRAITDAASGIIRVNSERICNSIEEYPFRENPYAPAALHEIEERILHIEENATKSLPEEIGEDVSANSPRSVEPSKNQRTKSSPEFQISSIVVIIFFIHSVLRVRGKMR